MSDDASFDWFRAHAEVLVGDYTKIAPEVGYVTWAWNALHGELSDLFALLAGTEDDRIAMVIWHSIKSDYGQREMLDNVAKVALEYNFECLEALTWLTSEAGKIAACRNDAIHTLWTTEKDPQRPFDLGSAAPDIEKGNPRGRRLIGNDPVATFRALSNHCVELIGFSRALWAQIQGWRDNLPLPERPQRPRVLRDYLDRKNIPSR